MTNYPFTKYTDLTNFLPESQVVIADYICSLCKGVYNQPCMDSCEHVFCKECLDIQMKTYNDMCPVLNIKIIKEKIYPINFLVQIISKQLLKCVNEHRGCDWSGKYADLSSHLFMSCLKQNVKCKYEKCNVEVFREESANHSEKCLYKPTECEHCNNQFPLNDIDVHYNECPNIKVKCPQKCDLLIERCKLDKHNADECENIMKKCHYHPYGCEEMCIKKEMNKHLDTNHEKHNLLLLKFFSNFQGGFIDRLSRLEGQIKNYSEKVLTLEKQLKGRSVNTSNTNTDYLKTKRERDQKIDYDDYQRDIKAKDV